VCHRSYSFTWNRGGKPAGSNPAPAGLYTFDVEVIANPYDRDAVRSQALTVVPGPVEYLGYDDGGTPEDESDDNLLYYLRWYALYSGRDASYGEIWLYDPELERVQSWIVPVLQCVVHENCDGLTANPNGETHGVIIPVPVSLKAGTYRFVLHFYDDYADSYRNHQIKAALEVNATTKPIAYIPDVDGGWLLVVLEPSMEKVSLPFTLKVQLDDSRNGRDYFTILEGVYKGKRESVTQGYLKRNPKYKQQIKLIYYKSRRILKIDGKNDEYIAVMDNPLSNGIYVIELPDYPHASGRHYLDKAKRALTWFRIRVVGSRYLHTGSVSAGCLTVTDVEKWDNLYREIIWCRKDGDDNAHGILEIRD